MVEVSDVASLLKKYDRNGDGSLDLLEFENLLMTGLPGGGNDVDPVAGQRSNEKFEEGRDLFRADRHVFGRKENEKAKGTGGGKHEPELGSPKEASLHPATMKANAVREMKRRSMMETRDSGRSSITSLGRSHSAAALSGPGGWNCSTSVVNRRTSSGTPGPALAQHAQSGYRAGGSMGVGGSARPSLDPSLLPKPLPSPYRIPKPYY